MIYSMVFFFDISMVVLYERYFYRKCVLLLEKSSGWMYNNLVNNCNVEFILLFVIKIIRN